MSPYYAIPLATFALGWVSAAVCLRERLLSLTTQRNAQAFRADRNRAERDLALVRIAQIESGGHFRAVPLRAVPKQGRP